MPHRMARCLQLGRFALGTAAGGVGISGQAVDVAPASPVPTVDDEHVEQHSVVRHKRDRAVHVVDQSVPDRPGVRADHGTAPAAAHDEGPRTGRGPDEDVRRPPLVELFLHDGGGYFSASPWRWRPMNNGARVRIVERRPDPFRPSRATA